MDELLSLIVNGRDLSAEELAALIRKHGYGKPSPMHPDTTDWWTQGAQLAQGYLKDCQHVSGGLGACPKCGERYDKVDEDCQPKVWPDKKTDAQPNDGPYYLGYQDGANAMHDAFFRVINGGKE